MIQLAVKIPKKFYLALSGGVDSMVLYHFFLTGRKDFKVIHFDHNTKYGRSARNLVEQLCVRHAVPFTTYNYPQKIGSEVEWSKWRNEIMQSADLPVITAHHLNDSVESYLMRGTPITLVNGNIIRPLILCDKSSILHYANNHNLIWLDDPSNEDSSYRRNKIRNELIPLMRECGINPVNLLKGFER